MTMHPINWRTARNTRTYVQVLIEQQQHFGSGIEQQPIVLSRDDKIRLLGFTTLHDTRRYALPQCWAPHTQTQRHGVLAMMNTPPINLGTRPGRIYLVETRRG
jgi:hypothetical protein